jgi:hypothetical protein
MLLSALLPLLQGAEVGALFYENCSVMLDCEEQIMVSCNTEVHMALHFKQKHSRFSPRNAHAAVNGF